MSNICASPYCDNEFEKSVWNQTYCSTRCKRDAANAKKRSALAEDVVKALAPTYEIDNDDTVEFLRREIQRQARELQKLKLVKNEQNLAVRSAIVEGLSHFQLPEIESPSFELDFENEEVAIVCISDLQLSKVTPTYNSEVAAQRMELYCQKVIDEINIRRSNKTISEVHVWLLGDIIEGNGSVFPGQTWLIDAGFYRQVTIYGPKILSKFLKHLLEEFEYVKVYGVIGNHGRLGSRSREDFDPESNGDRMLYRILDHIFADNPRIDFIIPDGPGERSWYAIDEIGNYSALLLHGDQFPSFASTYSIGRKLYGWKAGAIEQHWDEAFGGHFHQTAKLTFGKIVLRIAGTVESSNTYAQETLASTGRPSQLLLFVDPEKGVVTSESDVMLD